MFFFQAEDGIRCLVRSRGLGDVYKRQVLVTASSLSSQIKKFLTDTKAEDIVTKPILDYNRFVNKINYYIAS